MQATNLYGSNDHMSSEPPSSDVTPDQCATELMETVPIVMQYIRTQMRSQSASLLSVPQFRLLAFLSHYPDSSLSEVAEHLGVTRATASTMTDRLVQRAFVMREEHPKERRQVMLRLTEQGSSYLDQMQAITRSEIAILLNSLTKQQRLTVSAGLRALRQVFEAATSDTSTTKSAAKRT